MRRFKFVDWMNFHTEYSCEGDYEMPMDTHACFGSVFRRGFENKIIKLTYKIRVYNTLTKLNQGENNLALLNEKEIVEYLENAKKYCNYTFELTSKKGYYEITATLEGTHIAHKFLLTYIRYLYEMPFNLYLLEAFYLKKNVRVFKDVEILDLFNLVSATIPSHKHGTDIHAIGNSYDFKMLEPIEKIHKILEEGNLDRVNSIYRALNKKEFTTLVGDFENASYWTSFLKIRKRVDVYIENYIKILKHGE